jgi:hypothetical protein
MFSPYTWKSSPYQGMVRSHRAGHTTYNTFRVVSSKSDALSWIHPGQAPNPVIQAVLDHVASEVVENIRVALGGR